MSHSVVPRKYRSEDAENVDAEKRLEARFNFNLLLAHKPYQPLLFKNNPNLNDFSNF